MTFSACIEMLFVKETEDVAARIGLVAATGLTAFEFWRWTNKDIDAIENAMRETGLAVTGLVAEPMIALTDAANHAAFLEGLEQSIAVARRLGAPVLIAQAGSDVPGVERARQREALTACLARAADVLRGSGVRLAVEPLNTRIDHPGYFLASTTEALDIVDAVGRPEVGVLYDLYHSMVMDEVPQRVLAGRVDRVLHVHVADHPGRNEPGSGTLPLAAALGWLRDNGYRGAVGLEFRPTGGSAAAIAQALAALDAAASTPTGKEQ